MISPFNHKDADQLAALNDSFPRNYLRMLRDYDATDRRSDARIAEINLRVSDLGAGLIYLGQRLLDFRSIKAW